MDKDKLEKFFELRRARANLELAALDAMPLIYDVKTSNDICSSPHPIDIGRVWVDLDRAVKQAYSEARKSADAGEEES